MDGSKFIGVNSVNMKGEQLIPGHNFEEIFSIKTEKMTGVYGGSQWNSEEILFNAKMGENKARLQV